MTLYFIYFVFFFVFTFEIFTKLKLHIAFLVVKNITFTSCNLEIKKIKIKDDKDSNTFVTKVHII
jgi:hypothetical protein